MELKGMACKAEVAAAFGVWIEKIPATADLTGFRSLALVST